jgi:LysM repeat protein
MAYTVKKGDTLSAIAKANKTTVAAIQKANPEITNVNLIRPGQVFDIPTKTSKTGSAPKEPASATVPVVPAVPALTPQEIAAQILAASTASAAANAAEVARQQQAAEAERLRRAGQSAYDILLAEFSQYGLGSLVEPLKSLIISGPSSSELTLALRATDAYRKRFAANPERIKKGYAALDEASYLALEDGYQNVMRNYGLPASYYSKDSIGRQQGFEILIGGDVKVPELEERIILGKNELLEAPAETRQAFAQFFPNITDGDILGYVLNPEKGLSEIKRKVSAAQIGGAFLSAKTTAGAPLTTSLGRAEEFARAGVTEQTARQAATAIAGGLERGRQLSSFFQESPYTQTMAEEELLNLPGQVQAGEKRKKVIGLEKAEFGKRTGLTSGALTRDRSGSY